MHAPSLPGYASTTYDDAVEPDGSIRPHARPSLAAVLRHDLGELQRTVLADLADAGVEFTSVGGDSTWHVDAVPRVIPAAEWDEVAAGLAQRVRALNAFCADVYADRAIVREGVMPERVLESMDHLEPAMQGVHPRDGVWVGIAGLDLVRDGEGRWLVLEDNVRTPSGVAYWAAAREAVCRHLDVAEAPAPLDGLAELVRGALGPGRAVVLTDGPQNAAFWEHDWIARRLGIPLVTPDELEVRDGTPLLEGTEIEAVYRRSDQDTVDTPVGRLLHPVLCAGGARVVNSYGTGVADDKLAHAYVADMIRFYLQEEPVIESVETFDLADPAILARALDVFDELVVKDRSSYGGLGVAINPHAERADTEALRERVRANPAGYVAQRLVPLSTHPTIVDGELRPRHVDLRPFVFLAPDGEVRVSPGGLTRVALDEGAVVVNSSQNGGAKDTWVVPA